MVISSTTDLLLNVDVFEATVLRLGPRHPRLFQDLEALVEFLLPKDMNRFPYK
jgi:hypothetical protein